MTSQFHRPQRPAAPKIGIVECRPDVVVIEALHGALRVPGRVTVEEQRDRTFRITVHWREDARAPEAGPR